VPVEGLLAPKEKAELFVEAAPKEFVVEPPPNEKAEVDDVLG